ncbi:hypothetical protein QYF36_004701 [Acer negundo]|nr:hypothetical protein QYF36_004701 [Acer negundo]
MNINAKKDLQHEHSPRLQAAIVDFKLPSRCAIVDFKLAAWLETAAALELKENVDWERRRRLFERDSQMRFGLREIKDFEFQGFSFYKEYIVVGRFGRLKD